MTISVSAFSKLLAATAIGTLVVSGAVYADSNRADVTQTGADNSASVNQSVGEDHQTFLIQNEDRNQATITQRSNVQNQYFNPNGNKLGRLTDAAKQDGDDNKLTVYQDFVGNSGNEIGAGGAGLDQVGDANAATINQYGSRNIVTELQQTSTGAVGNTIVINQGLSGSLSAYAYNRVDAAHQSGTNNEATLTQSGPSDGTLNRIMRLEQDGSGNTADVTQDGRRNVVAKASQTGTGNSLTITLEGDRNGSTLADGLNEQLPGSLPMWSLAAEFAANNGIEVSSVVQNGTGNEASYTANGNLNQFGIRQTGANNELVSITTGSENQLIARQSGSSVADAFVTGDRNVLVFNQSSSGALVTASVSVNGDGNNAASLGGFTAGGPARAAAYDFMRPGLIQQFSAGSTIDLDVGASVKSDNNRFSLYQAGGSNNKIDGSIDGSNNQVAVMQDGSSNVANFTQIGGGNNLGIRQ